MYDTLKSLNICGVVGPHQGNKDVMPFSLPTTKALCAVHRKGESKSILANAYIVKSKQQIQKELSHTIKSRCACVWIYGGYIWWLT